MKTLTFKASLSCGDMIYSLASVKAICEQLDCKAIYYINQSRYTNLDTFKALEMLLYYQDYIEVVEQYSGQKIDIDFDKWRTQYKYDIAIPLQLAAIAQQQIKEKVSIDLTKPWLKEMPYMDGFNTYTAFNNTNRYQKFSFDFHKQILLSKKALFLGTDKEFMRYKAHRNLYQHSCIDLYEVACVIANVKALYCNQSACLTIAQGLKIDNLFLAKDRGFNNTVLGNEIIL